MNAHIHSFMVRLNGCLHVDNKYVAEFLQSIILDVKHEKKSFKTTNILFYLYQQFVKQQLTKSFWM